MDIIAYKIGILENLLSNLKKAPNRQYRKITLKNKLEQVNTIRKDIAYELTILEDSINSKVFDNILHKEKLLSGGIINIINSKLEDLGDRPEFTLKNLTKLAIISIRLSKAAKMTTLIEIIKTVTALLPTYDGNTPHKLNNFLDALNVVKQVSTNETYLPTIINIIMTKLEGKARYAFPAAPASIDAVITKLKEVSTPTPPEAIIAKLANCKQKSNITGYTKEVEELTMLLEAAYIAKQIPAEVAKAMATKEGIKHMAIGLKDEKTSIILRAGQYANICEAVNKVLQESPQISNEVTVNYARSYDRQQNFGWQTSRYYQNNSRYRGRNRGQYNNNNNRYNQNRRDPGYNRDNRNDNANNRQRYDNNQSRGRNNHQRNVYFAENGRGPSENPRSKAQQDKGEVTYPNKE